TARVHLYRHSFPTRRSSDLGGASAQGRRREWAGFTGLKPVAWGSQDPVDVVFVRKKSRSGTGFFRVWPFASAHRANVAVQAALVDRKSTRLNSSHVKISYAV